MNIIKIIFTNGFIPIIPVLLWNMILAKKLPPTFQAKTFDKNIPRFLLIGENVFRIIIFILPLFLQIDIHSKYGLSGLIVYLTGVILYFISWLILIIVPDSAWSKSVYGFTAPAYTPLIWMLGLSLMFDSFYFKIPYVAWEYAVPAFVMICFHFSHARLAYKKHPVISDL